MQSEIATGVDFTALNQQVGVGARSIGLNANIAARINGAAACRVAAAAGTVARAAATQTKAQTHTAELIGNVGIAHGAIGVFDLAVGIALPIAYRIDTSFCRQGSAGAGQQFRASAAGFRGGLIHFFDGLDCIQRHAAHAYAEAALLHAALNARLSGFPCFRDGDVLRVDVDIALHCNHITPGLAIEIAGADIDIAGVAAHDRSGGAGAAAGLLQAMRTLSDGEAARTAATEQTGFAGFPGLAGGTTVTRCFDGHIALGREGKVTVTDDGAAFDS